MSIEEETRAILAEGGAQHTRVTADNNGWLVAFGFAPNYIEEAGHTGIDPTTPTDPREFARYMLAKRAARLASAADPAQIAAHEAHGETGGKDQKADGTSDSFSDIDAGMVDSAAPEEAIAGSGVEGSDAQGVAGGALDVPESQAQDDPGASEQGAVDSGDEGVAGGDAGGAEAGPAGGGSEVLAHDGQAWPSDSEPEVDYEADFEEIGEPSAEVEGADALLELEPPSLGEEILEQQEQESPQGQDRFIGLDDLDRRRSLRIGDVTVAAATRMPNVDWPTLAELRNFAMGVSENRWPNDDAKQAALLELEGIASHRRQIEMLRDERVAFLLSASREEVEAFDPEAGWP